MFFSWWKKDLLPLLLFLFSFSHKLLQGEFFYGFVYRPLNPMPLEAKLFFLISTLRTITKLPTTFFLAFHFKI